MASLPRSQPRTTSCKRVLRRWSEYVEARGTDGCDLQRRRFGARQRAQLPGSQRGNSRQGQSIKCRARAVAFDTFSLPWLSAKYRLSSSPSLHSMQGVVAVQLAGSDERAQIYLAVLIFPPLDETRRTPWEKWDGEGHGGVPRFLRARGRGMGAVVWRGRGGSQLAERHPARGGPQLAERHPARSLKRFIPPADCR